MRVDRDLQQTTPTPSGSEPKEPMPVGSSPTRWPLVVIVVGLATSLVWTMALVWLAIRLIS